MAAERSKMSPALQFLQTVVEDAPALAAKFESTMLEWKQEPPITIAFGEIGQAIVENWDVIPETVLRNVLAKVEMGMLTADPEIQAGTATGLVEAMVSPTDHDSELRFKVEQLLGAASLKHFQAWRDFGKK
jgi:hypothetical protein